MKKTCFLLSVLLVLSVAATAQTDSDSSPPDSGKDRRYLSFKDAGRIFELLEGKWALENRDCSRGFTIIVSKDRKTLTLSYSTGENEAKYVYDVLATEDHYVRTSIRGEKRLGPDKKPLVWDFLFLTEDSFVWRAAHWPPDGSTPAYVRCEEPIV